MSLAVPLTHLAELGDAEERLTADLAARDTGWATAPSALPGWTRAHVVAHLAGNAEGLLNLVTWADTGVETPMYPSLEVRAAEIQRRSTLAWPDLRSEQQQLAHDLAHALRGLSEPVAERHLRMGSGAGVNVCDLAATRTREVEIHRVDLDSDYRAEHWSTAFTLRTFGQLSPFFRSQRDVPVHTLRSTDTGNCWEVGATGPDLLGREADLLAWLLGRPHGQVISTAGAVLAAAPAWV